ncbi:MAG: hypothetical protein JWL95_3046 [Gemmatimonadetes bacterium]|nr:hypothetical protein [Gemmatimonadota bacterium]
MDRSALIVILLSCLFATPGAQAQSRPETIRGRVTSDSGFPISGATVSATMAPDRTFQQTTSDTAGRFTIRFAAGTGDYLVHVSAVGYRSQRKRLTRAPADTSLTIDLRLTPEVTQLAEVKVQASKPRPYRGAGEPNEAGASERELEGVFSAVAPNDEGNLFALANAIPGASARGDGLSVLGLGGDQSNATLNGMAFAGPGLPREANTRVRVSTSTYDPARGGFSGGQTAIELSPGSRFYSRRAHVTMDAPLLQETSTIGNQLGQRFTSLNGSIGGSGELKEDVWYYNNSLQVSRRTSDAASLLSLGDEALRASGVAPDSALRLQRLLGAAKIPLTGSSVPGDAVSQSLTFASRIDHSPYKKGEFAPAARTWNVTLYGNVTDDQALAFTPSSVPTHGGQRRNAFVSAQADYSAYVGDVLNDTRSALSVQRETGTPYLRLPSGTVLLSSTLPGSDGALSTLTFGGNGALDYRRSAWTWESINETQWYPHGSAHRLKLTLSSRFDGYSRSAAEDLLGGFVFPSLAALEAGQPSSFSRTLAAPARDGGEWNGFAALGDYWRVTRSLSLVYGARLEGNRYLTSLVENAAALSAFGASTASAPDRMHVSPRLGFTWYFGKTPSYGGTSFTSFAKLSAPSTMMIRGGIGEFRGLLAPTLLGDASAANGLPGGLSRVTCVGAATPTPAWSDYLTESANIPITCLNGAPSKFSDASPTIRLFDPSFDAARSWRASLYWTRVAGPFAVSLDGVYSLNLNQPGIVDLNFGDTPRFTLSQEGGRPVFVSPTSIVPATGVLSSVESRARTSFGSVLSSRSDLRSTSRQFTATLAPKNLGGVFYSVAYTLGDMRADARGFDGATFDTPKRLERRPGDLDVRHQFLLSFAKRLRYGMDVSLFTRIMSGAPYTPRVSGDINGDGSWNDRAFIFDPARVAEPTLRDGMRNLLDNSSSEARSCLLAQLGMPAERNSCRGPWTAYTNARLTLYSRFGFTKRSFTAALNVTNPIGGLDQLLHGSNDLHGWGNTALPDPMLLIVRGFDSATKNFRYDVNPRFGSTRSTRQIARVPFRLTVDLSFDLGLPMVKQQAIRLLQPGRRGRTGARMSADSMVRPLARNVPDIYQEIMEESDSLLISRDQMDSLKTAQVLYKRKSDSLWMSVTTKLAAMGDDYDADAAMYMIDDATERAWLLDRDELPVLERILSPLQLRMAPLVSTLQRAVGKKSVGIRMFSY